MGDDRAYRQARRTAKLAVVAMLSSIALNATGDVTLGPPLGAAGLLLGLYAAHKLGRTGGEHAGGQPPR